MSEWEEEIAKLKQILEDKELSHRAERERLEEDCRRKLRESQHSPEAEAVKAADCTGVWAASSQSFSPHSALVSQGPQSLPSEMVSEAQREVRRLQQLRRYIQEECDQLLLRKERLKEEVVWQHNYASLDGHFCGHKSLLFHRKRGAGLQEAQEGCMQINKETSL